MKAAAVLALVLLGAGSAHAQLPPGVSPEGPPPIFEPIRKAFEAGDYAEAKRLLLRAYELEPNPKLLFALAQAELNLGNYAAAIDYYEKFIASNPGPEQVALAQQGIGAARMRLKEKPVDKPVVDKPVDKPLPEAPPPPPEGKRWTLTHTGLVAFGGAAMLLGGGLLLYSRSLGNDRSGTLSTYDARVEQAHTTRWTGVGIAAAGTLLVGVTLLW